MFIIALGESILLLGDTLVKMQLTVPVVSAAGLGFLLILSLWWIYFLQTTEEGERRLSIEACRVDHTRLSRSGLYAHGIMVCGAIVVAVSIEQIVRHPDQPVEIETVCTAVSGPAIFLIGSSLYHRVMAERIPRTYLLAVLLIALWACASFYLKLANIFLGLGVNLVMLTLAALEPHPTEIGPDSHGADSYQPLPV